MKYNIEKVMKLSARYKRLMDDDNEVIVTLNELQKEDLVKTEEYLKSRLSKTVKKEKVPSPVNMCRLRVIKYLLEQGAISKDVIERIKKDIINDVNQTGAAGNPFKSWGSYFRMFYTCFYLKNQQEIRKQLVDIAENLQKDLNLTEETKHNTVDFGGAQQQGATGCWLAVYNKSHKKSGHALQLFVQFMHPNVTYGLYRAPDQSFLTKKEINVETEAWDYEKMKSFLEPSRQKIIDDFSSAMEGEIKQVEGQKKNKNEEKAQPLNRILYGPPGTGKTYSTVRHALEILGEEDSSIEGIQQLKDKFTGQVEFVTFHQSFSYEDFVEGLKAEVVDGQISYSVKPGVFKEICKAASSKGMRDSSTEKIDSDATIWKMSLGDSQTKDGAIYFEEALDSDSLVLGWGGVTDFSQCKDKSEVDSIYKGGGGRFVKEFIFGMKEGDIVIVSDGNHKFKAIAKITGPYYYDDGSDLPQKRKIEWLQIFSESRPVLDISDKNFTQATIFKPQYIKKDRLDECLTTESVITNNKPYILIIDEINRGNISRVFGELITLIEHTKRDGKDEAVSVQLPYSKDSEKSFSVPNNLYIIGTMNTADRSLALMDTALRRRFDFIEMTPNYDLLLDDLDGIELQKMLRIMNQRIEVLYDREHMIGHSFLMHLKTFDDLKHAFINKIQPLLEEYFYDDWQKIKLVLADNDDLFYKKASFESNLFRSMGNEIEQTESYRRATSSDLKEDAFINIYKGTGSAEEGNK